MQYYYIHISDVSLYSMLLVKYISIVNVANVIHMHLHAFCMTMKKIVSCCPTLAQHPRFATDVGDGVSDGVRAAAGADVGVAED